MDSARARFALTCLLVFIAAGCQDVQVAQIPDADADATDVADSAEATMVDSSDAALDSFVNAFDAGD